MSCMSIPAGEATNTNVVYCIFTATYVVIVYFVVCLHTSLGEDVVIFQVTCFELAQLPW